MARVLFIALANNWHRNKVVFTKDLRFYVYKDQNQMGLQIYNGSTNVKRRILKLKSREIIFSVDLKYVSLWTIEDLPFVFRYLVNLGCIKPLCDLLTVMDSKIVQVALNGLENILRLGEQEAKQENNGTGVNPYCSLIEEAYGMLRTIRNTQSLYNWYLVRIMSLINRS